MAKKPVGIDPNDPDASDDLTVPESGDRDWYTLAQDVVVQGRDCKKGGQLQLTAEEAEAMKAAGVRFEGDEEPTPEEVQAKHDEGAEAQRKEVEERPIRDERAQLDARRDELEKEQAALDKKEAELPALED